MYVMNSAHTHSIYQGRPRRAWIFDIHSPVSHLWPGRICTGSYGIRRWIVGYCLACLNTADNDEFLREPSHCWPSQSWMRDTEGQVRGD